MRSKKSEPDSLLKQFTRDYFIVSFIPLILSFTLFVGITWVGRNYLTRLMLNSTSELNHDAEKSLQKLGEEIIKAKAEDVAKQIELYFKMHPNVHITKMRDDPYFMKLAIQRVGKTGYTAITEAFTYLFRVHPNKKLNDTDMRPLAKVLPSWWKIVEGAIGGEPFQGYYDWKEPDGSIRKKYIAVTPVAIKHQGIIFMISATTYIDEFSTPVKDMRIKSDTIVKNYRAHISQQWLMFSMIAAGISLLTFIGIYYMGRKAGLRFMLPITRLADTAIKFGQGDWDSPTHSDDFQREDEIGTLARAFNQMSGQLKALFSDLELRLAELKETQSALKASEEHYRSLFDGVPMGLYRTAPDGRGLDVNTKLVEMLGFPNRESLLGVNAASHYVDPEDRIVWKEQIKNAGGIYSYQTRMKKLNGEIMWVENNANAVFDDEGNILYYEGSLKDITEQKKAEEALRASEEKFRELYEESVRTEKLYRSLIHSSADALLLFDLNMYITYSSPMFTRIFGWIEDELTGRKLPSEFVPNSSEIESVFSTVIKTGNPFQGFEISCLTRDGRALNISISASRYDDHEGRPAGMLAILRDISEKKRLEAQLHHSERLEAIGTLAGGIAHDFNNLLMVIQGSISLLLYGLDELSPYFASFKNIEKQVRRGSQLTRQLLGYARKGKYEVRAVNINNIITESLEAFGRTRKDITVKYNLQTDIRAIEADIYQIEQVLMNLYINAFDAMPDGGQLLIETANCGADLVMEKTLEKTTGDFVMIKISDTGCGMDSKTLSRIFEPFFTTKGMDKGTGLGLASAYGIVKSHDGYITAVSEPGSGSEFTIFLPSTDKLINETVYEPKKAVAGKGTILFIDDEELVLDTGSLMLEALGYTILRAESVQKAIILMNENIDKIDLVILDMIMPDIGGSQAFDIIKSIKPDVSVLLSSGYSLDGKAREIMNKGCNGFIQKPYSIEELSEKIKMIISS